MKVAELIELLSKFPKDLDVALNGMVENIDARVVEDYPIGDYANPNCEYRNVVYVE